MSNSDMPSIYVTRIKIEELTVIRVSVEQICVTIIRVILCDGTGNNRNQCIRDLTVSV